MKTLLFCLCCISAITFWSNPLSAQCNNVNGDIETYTADPSEDWFMSTSFTEYLIFPGSDWINSYIPNWFASHGTPNPMFNEDTDDTYLFTFSEGTNIANTGEGIYTEYNFISGNTYEITYSIYRTEIIGSTSFMNVKLATGLVPEAPFSASFDIPTPTSSQTVSELPWTTTGTWETITEVVTATDDFDQLWFYPFAEPGSFGNLITCWVDDVCIRNLSTDGPCDFLPEMYRREGPCEWEFANTTTPPNSDYTILKTEWDFGDGTTGEGETVKHYYSSPGDYAVCMTVWMSYGSECCKKTVCYLVSVTESCSPCTVMNFADFDVSGTDTPNPVFNVTGIPESMTNVYGYYWEFGDGVETGTGETTSHTYENGNYTVCLTLFYFDPIKEECCSKTICKEISINFPGIRSNIPQPELSTRNESQTLKAIPNPNNGSFILNAQTEINSVHVYAPTGKLIYQTQNPNNTTIDLKGIEKGIYLVVINQNDYETRNFTKIIIE